MSTPNVSNYTEQGGAKTVIGGEIDVTGSLKIGSTAVTSSASEINKLDGAIDSVVYNQYHRVTTAEINAGHSLVDVPTDKKFRLVDITLIAIGGNAATATSVDVKCGSVVMVSAAVGALTRSTVVKPDTANVTVLADGASFVSMTAGDDVTIIKAGSDLATATHIDVILSYVLENA